MKVAVTIGDPAGIGPEVAVRALAGKFRKHRARILLLGPAFFFNDLAEKLRLRVRFEDACGPPPRTPSPAVVSCWWPYDFPEKVVRGAFDRRLTEAAVLSIRMAVRLAMQKKVDAIVTPPIHKAGLRKAGFEIPGHTEYLAELSKTKSYGMMLVGGPLRVTLVTRHVAIKDVPKKLTRRGVEEAILLTDRELRRSFGIRRPRIVVCGLNPHAGEEGTIGSEEITRIAPAVRRCRRRTDARIVGPLSSDALFCDAYRGRYDAEICMYHDQGLIPLKMISRGGGVNVTLGLPFVRTSPDHGTAYDIAGRFQADAGSMESAITLALKLAANRKKHDARRRN